jgi:hypothetical protein
MATKIIDPDDPIDWDRLERWILRHPMERDVLPTLPVKQLLLVAQITSWQYHRERVLRKLFARELRRARKHIEVLLEVVPVAESTGARAGRLATYLRNWDKLKQAEKLHDARVAGGLAAGRARKDSALKLRKDIHEIADSLLRNRRPPRDIAGIIAARLDGRLAGSKQSRARTVRNALRDHASGHWYREGKRK